MAKLEESEKLIIEADALFSSLPEKEQNEILLWNAVLIHVKGNIQIDKGSIIYGIKYWENAIRIFETLNHTTRVAALVSNIGLHFALLGQIDRGLEYLNEAKKINSKRSET